MSSQKRLLDDSASSNHKQKKTKLSAKTTDANSDLSSRTASVLVLDEVDFPRGGGTTFTPFQVKAIRSEGVQEANQELFEVHIYVFNEGPALMTLNKRLKKPSFLREASRNPAERHLPNFSLKNQIKFESSISITR